MNIIIQNLKKELEATKKKMQETQEELSAWKFTPDSVTGKRLMSKCRLLLQENEDLGKMISSGRLAKLESELAMQKALCEEMKKNQVEMDDFVDVHGVLWMTVIAGASGRHPVHRGYVLWYFRFM